MARDKGDVLEKAIRNSGLSIAKVAKLSGIPRQTLYNSFTYEEVEWDIFVKVGKAIGYDFTLDFPEMRDPFGNEDEQTDRTYMNAYRSELDEYKTKYIQLQESYITLQEKYLALLERFQPKTGIDHNHTPSHDGQKERIRPEMDGHSEARAES